MGCRETAGKIKIVEMQVVNVVANETRLSAKYQSFQEKDFKILTTSNEKTNRSMKRSTTHFNLKRQAFMLLDQYWKKLWTSSRL